MAAQLEQRLRELDAERGRLREAIARFGDALAATHDPYALLPVIVENTVEATGARRRPARRRRERDRARGRSGRRRALARHPARDRGPRERRPLPHAEGQRLQRRGARAGPLARLAGLDRARERAAAPARRAAGEHRRAHRAPQPPSLRRGAGGRDLPRRALRRQPRADPRRPRRLQAGQRPLRPPGRRRRPADVRRHPARRPSARSTCPRATAARSSPSSSRRPTSRAPSELAERLCKALAARPMPTHPGALVAVTASFGVAAFPDSPTPAGAVRRGRRGPLSCQACWKELCRGRGRGYHRPRARLALLRSPSRLQSGAAPVPDPEVVSE